jgi:hypothetical protein
MAPFVKETVAAAADAACLRGDAEDDYRAALEEEAAEKQDRLDDLNSDVEWV